MQNIRKMGKGETKKTDYRLDYIYAYLFEHNIQASSKCFPFLSEGILYAIDNPRCTYDFIINRLALTHGEPATRIRDNIRYTLKTNEEASPKAFVFNAAAFLRVHIEKEQRRDKQVIAFSS